jgi:hypothetical protein
MNTEPGSHEDVLCGKQAILEFGRAAVALGGCPLAEHGVGRKPGEAGCCGSSTATTASLRCVQ